MQFLSKKAEVNHDMIPEPLSVSGTFLVDEQNEKEFSVDYIYTGNDDTDPDEDIDLNFLYPWFYYDEGQECAVFNIQKNRLGT